MSSEPRISEMPISEGSDPYCVISFDGSEAAPQKQQTFVAKETLSPIWNVDMYFLVSEDCKQFKVEVYDEDIGRDDTLGHCHILRKDKHERGKLSGDYYYLEDGKGASVEIWTQEVADPSNGLGMILAERYQAVQEYVAVQNLDYIALIEVSLHNAEGLKSGIIDKSDPYAKFDFSNDPQKERIHPHKLRTKTIENNPSPVWEEVFYFLVPYDLDTFKVEIMDENVGIDDSLGNVNIAVANVGTVKTREKLAVSKKGSLTLSYAYVPLKPLFDYIAEAEPEMEPELETASIHRTFSES
jgi:Ca2+-dependent lipid-binding protein